MDRLVDERQFSENEGGSGAPLELVSKEPLTLMPWEIQTLGAANVADFLREVRDHMARMPLDGDLRGRQIAAENAIMAVWQAEKSTRSDLVCALATYGNTHFDKDEDDRDD